MEYQSKDVAAIQSFLDERKKSAAFDSAAAVEVMKSDAVPAELRQVMDEAGKFGGEIAAALDSALSAYERDHGVAAPADIVNNAIHQAYSTTRDAAQKFALDSAADSNHHAGTALQANRAVVAIVSAITEAIPFAHYLPADIKSNKALLGIVTHRTGHQTGSYAKDGSLDGANSGDVYISQRRVDTKAPASGTVTGKITKIQETPNTTDANGGDTKLLRGRTTVYVNGLLAGRETTSSGTGASPIAGQITLAGVQYTLSGNINTDTGVYTINSTPALPSGAEVAVEGVIDLERSPDLTPSIISAVDMFELYASPWRVTTHQTIEFRTQVANELNLDPHSESLLAIHAQFANERHYEALRKAYRVAKANPNVNTFDYDAHKAMHDNGRASVWQDLSYPLEACSQQMAIDTMSHGVSHLYVGKRVAAQLRGLPTTLFQPSGVKPRPGIYRLGKLFGQYDVYFTPKVLTETETSSQILCIGRSDDVARSAIVLGDAVAPMVLPLAVNADLRQGAGFHARNFTEVNPHQPSAMGAALINVTNF